MGNPHLVVAQSQIKLGEVLGIAQLVQQIPNQRDEIGVVNCHLVKGSVVYAQMQAFVMFLMK